MILIFAIIAFLFVVTYIAYEGLEARVKQLEEVSSVLIVNNIGSMLGEMNVKAATKAKTGKKGKK